MGLPRCMPVLAALHHPRLTASAMRSDPCETSTQQMDGAEETNALPGVAIRVRGHLTTETQRLPLRLPLPSNPPGPRTTISVGSSTSTSLLQSISTGSVPSTICLTLSNLVVQEPHLLDAPRPSNRRANLAATIRGRLDTCQHRFTLIRRLIEASSRRASSTVGQTLVHLDRRDQADGPPRNRLRTSLIPLMTMMMRIHCNMTRPAARGVAEIRIQPHGLHRAIGPSAGRIASHETEDSREMQVTGLLKIPAPRHNRVSEHQALGHQVLGHQVLGHQALGHRALEYQALEVLLPQGSILGHRLEGLQLDRALECPLVEGRLLDGPRRLRPLQLEVQAVEKSRLDTSVPKLGTVQC